VPSPFIQKVSGRRQHRYEVFLRLRTKVVMKREVLKFAVVVTVGSVGSASACDLCAVYSAAQAHGEIGKGPFAGLAEQFSHFGTVQVDGHEIPNEAGQFMNSSVSQVFVGYNFNDHIGLQFNLPVIYRWFERPNGQGGIESGSEYGVGDVSLLANFSPYTYQSMDATFRWTVTGGLKLPTGSSDRIAEEFNEIEDPVGPASGIHGHDLALGSGSFDGIISSSLFGRMKRGYFSANIQYMVRSKGDFDYRYADDLTWSGGPGYYAVLSEKWTLGLQAIVSGEHKDLDEFQGAPAEDTGITAVYLGPQVNLTWGEKLSAFVGLDLPVLQDNTALQTVPDYRIRGGLTYRF